LIIVRSFSGLPAKTLHCPTQAERQIQHLQPAPTPRARNTSFQPEDLCQ
jgi:hypothetical protein